MPAKGQTEPLTDRFFAKCDRPSVNDCWEWLGMKAQGYGYIWYRGKMLRSHRVSWSIYHGRWAPKESVVMHSCDNRGCVNPRHLSLGTHRENNRQIVERRRHGNQWRKQLDGAPPERAASDE